MIDASAFVELSRTSHEFLVACDRAGVVQYADERATRIIGARRGDSLHALVASGSVEKFDEFLERSCASRVESCEIPFVLLGTPPLSASLSSVPHPLGALVLGHVIPDEFASAMNHVSGMVSEVVELNRAVLVQRNELRTAMELRDNFLAMLGHELRNPIGTITTAIYMLERRRHATSFARYVDILRRQSGNLGRIVEDILDVTRITSGKVVLHQEIIDLREIATSFVLAHEDAFEGSRHIVRLDVAAVPVLVLGDKVRLEQVVSNLVTNALKYSPAGSHIDICVASDAGKARLEVSDDGVGMDETLRDHVFDVFVQGKQTIDRSRGGLGLGLTVVRQLVELHGGAVTAFSEGEGKGSRFLVQIPLAAPEAVVTPVADEVVPRSVILRIVVIEDDVDGRSALEEALSDLGHLVEVSSSGREGLKLVLDRKPDVAIIDIGLPGLDGYEVARQIRARWDGTVPRLIAMTGYGQPEDRLRAQSAGFDVHVVKPISISELQRTLVREHGMS